MVHAAGGMEGSVRREVSDRASTLAMKAMNLLWPPTPPVVLVS